jgi:hypothetical protein
VASQRDTVRALLDRHGRTFAEELRIDVRTGKPAPLFRLLCAAALMSARIDSGIAVEAARNSALNEAGYTRYQERTATMLGDLNEHLLERWKEGPGRRAGAAARAQGVGDVGVDIFVREAQVAWELAGGYDKVRKAAV